MVNGHNLSPEEQKEYYGSKYASRNWDSLNPDAQEAARELWDVLYHHYSLAEFYDDLEEHPWANALASGYNSSEAINKIIEYNGDEFQKLYDEYSAWAQDVEGDVVKPERPPAEFNEDDDEEEDDE